METQVKFENVDFMEGARYIALNWDAKQCAASSLRRILPTRRGKRGARPGPKGEGPQGKEIGDQEQWVFPKVILTEDEKREIVATIISIATNALFENHFYHFGGEMKRQRDGGPIGLRGTCSIARLVLVMQVFDKKWRKRVEEAGLRLFLVLRYMDDGRVFMPPVKPGWRWVGAKLLFCHAWQVEDAKLSPLEITKRVVHGSLGGVMSYLKFTIETEEDFGDN